MNNLTLKQLRYFEALARLGHFGLAAEASAISQPALSMQIKELETGLGTSLVDRSTRQIRLTAFGEEFLGRAREILRAVDELGELARAAGQGLSGRLRLGVIPTVAPYLLPALMERLMQTYAGLDLHLRESLTSNLLKELHDGQIDAAIVALPVSEPNLQEVPLFSERFVLVRPASAAGEPVPDAEMLREMRLLLLQEGHCFRDQALSFCEIGSQKPREVLEGSSLSTLVQMVGAGIGVTLIPEMAVPIETGTANVTLDHFAAPEPRRSIGMIWRRSHPLADRFGELAGIVQQVAGAADEAR